MRGAPEPLALCGVPLVPAALLCPLYQVLVGGGLRAGLEQTPFFCSDPFLTSI